MNDVISLEVEQCTKVPAGDVVHALCVLPVFLGYSVQPDIHLPYKVFWCWVPEVRG